MTIQKAVLIASGIVAFDGAVNRWKSLHTIAAAILLVAATVKLAESVS